MAMIFNTQLYKFSELISNDQPPSPDPNPDVPPDPQLPSEKHTIAWRELIICLVLCGCMFIAATISLIRQIRVKNPQFLLILNGLLILVQVLVSTAYILNYRYLVNCTPEDNCTSQQTHYQIKFPDSYFALIGIAMSCYMVIFWGFASENWIISRKYVQAYMGQLDTTSVKKVRCFQIFRYIMLGFCIILPIAFAITDADFTKDPNGRTIQQKIWAGIVLGSITVIFLMTFIAFLNSLLYIRWATNKEKNFALSSFQMVFQIVTMLLNFIALLGFDACSLAVSESKNPTQFFTSYQWSYNLVYLTSFSCQIMIVIIWQMIASTNARNREEQRQLQNEESNKRIVSKEALKSFGSPSNTNQIAFSADLFQDSSYNTDDGEQNQNFNNFSDLGDNIVMWNLLQRRDSRRSMDGPNFFTSSFENIDNYSPQAIDSRGSLNY